MLPIPLNAAALRRAKIYRASVEVWEAPILRPRCARRTLVGGVLPIAAELL